MLEILGENMLRKINRKQKSSKGEQEEQYKEVTSDFFYISYKFTISPSSLRLHYMVPFFPYSTLFHQQLHKSPIHFLHFQQRVHMRFPVFYKDTYCFICNQVLSNFQMFKAMEAFKLSPPLHCVHLTDEK